MNKYFFILLLCLVTSNTFAFDSSNTSGYLCLPDDGVGRPSEGSSFWKEYLNQKKAHTIKEHVDIVYMGVDADLQGLISTQCPNVPSDDETKKSFISEEYYACQKACKDRIENDIDLLLIGQSQAITIGNECQKICTVDKENQLVYLEGFSKGQSQKDCRAEQKTPGPSSTDGASTHQLIYLSGFTKGQSQRNCQTDQKPPSANPASAK